MNTDAGQTPAFATAAACREWLATAPLTDAGQMVALFLRELKLHNRTQLDPTERLDILELLRRPIYEAQEAFSRKFAGKLQPLSAPEQAAFDSCCTLWHTLATGYMRCAEACFANDPQMKSKAALVLERALATLVAGQIEIHRASRMPSAEHWRVLHQLYAAAEHLNVTTIDVTDASHYGKTPVNPQSAYVEALLLALANLHEHSQKQIAWVVRWARRWAPKLRVLAAAPELGQALPLCVDIGSDAPPGYKPFATSGARWLDTVELRHSLTKRLSLLAQGEDPAKLNLGSDCTQPACEQLLTLIYQRWCKGGAVRGFERRPASGPCRFVAGIEGIHYYVAGRKPFHQIAPKDISLLRREQEEIATFGRVASHRDEHFSEQKGYAVEEWQTLEDWHMVNTSSAGLRITRPLAQNGVRLGLRQLVAVSNGDNEDWLLGCVRWTLVADAFEIGLLLFPGRPEAIALRGSGLAAHSEPFRPGFLLPAIPAIKQEASILVPAGTFKPGRLLDIYAGKPGRVRLTKPLDRGPDFERVIYESA